MSAAKLMSGYIELTVKKSADAFKEITAELTNVGKQADKVGKQAGESIGGGIAKGARAGGRAVQEELSKSEAAAEDAGQKAGDALEKGITKSAKRAGKSIGDEITKASKKASDDAIITPKVDTRSARETMVRDIGGGILDAARKGAQDAGVDLDRWAIEQAGKLGGKLGEAIGDTGLRDLLKPIVEQGGQAADAWDRFRDTMIGINPKSLDSLAGTLRGVAGVDLHPVTSNMLDLLGALSKSPDAASKANGLAGALAKVGGTAGQLAAAAAAWKGIVDLSGDIAKIPGVAGATDWIQKAPAAAGGWVHDHLRLPTITPDPELTKPGGMFGPPAGTPAPAVVPPMPQDVQDKLHRVMLPGNAKGGIAGVTGAGQVFGPGTGTSDSILGVGVDGVPTARVSVGEGIIRKAAMDRGWNKMVAAANAGMLPGFDSGTGMGGVPAPDPMMQRFYDALQSGRILPNGQLPMGVGSEDGLQINTIRGKRTISALFPEITNIGGYRQDRLKWHPNGLALDVMVPGQGGLNDPTTPAGKALGDQINAFLQQNSVALGSDYSMWQVPDHHNHVHANFAPSGMPGKDQQYFLPPQLQAMLAGASGAGLAVGGGQMPNMAMMLGANGQAAQIAAMLGMGGQTAVGQQLGTGLPSGVGRTQGLVPAAAGASGKAGTSFASGLYQMGASAINGLIDQAASAAATAVSMGAMAGSFGAGGQAAGSAASFAIGMVTQAAKRGVQYTAQMAGIGTDALAEILMPFGAPRLFNTDVAQFAPQLPGMPAAVTTGEKAQQAAQGDSQAQPGGPVQPNQMPGQQPISAPLQFAQPQGITPTAPPIVGPPGPSPANVAGIKPPPGPIVPGMGQPTQGVGAPVVPAPSGSFLDSWLPNLIGHRKGGVVGVYDDGGWLMPGGTAVNLSKRPEPVLNSEQWGDLQMIASQPMPTPDPKAISGYAPDYSVNISGVTVTDVNALQKEIDSRQRLQMMRHAGRP